jgi:hypothetical protein
MSFNSNNKPRLVEPKLSKYYISKIKEKELKNKLAQEEIVKQKIELEISNQPPEPFYKKISKYIYDFIIENYGFIILVSLFGILLYVRFIEVNKRKAQMKELLDKINTEKQQGSNSGINSDSESNINSE